MTGLVTALHSGLRTGVKWNFFSFLGFFGLIRPWFTLGLPAFVWFCTRPADPYLLPLTIPTVAVETLLQEKSAKPYA